MQSPQAVSAPPPVVLVPLFHKWKRFEPMTHPRIAPGQLANPQQNMPRSTRGVHSCWTPATRFCPSSRVQALEPSSLAPMAPPSGPYSRTRQWR